MSCLSPLNFAISPLPLCNSVLPTAMLPARTQPVTTVPMPGSAFSGGLVDPEIREWAWQLLFGGAMRSANTPAVDLDSGRIFVAATSTSEGKGALYALDLIEKETALEIAIAFATEMGPGSGSSPSLSPSGDAVYVNDEAGVFYAVDADSGELRWQVQTKSTSAAAAVGKNGDIYALQAYGPALVAITPDGLVRWQSELQALTDAAGVLQQAAKQTSCSFRSPTVTRRMLGGGFPGW